METVTSKKSFLHSSGLNKGDMELNGVKGRSDRIGIIYRDPVTKERMTTPDGSIFMRFRLLDPAYNDKGKLIKYRTCKNGGIHL